MSDNAFFEQPILNSPYHYPNRHWELDKDGQPTQKILDFRRPADFISPIPKPRKQGRAEQATLLEDAAAKAISSEDQKYHKDLINEIRHHVTEWRKLPLQEWRVTPVTARLLKYWREHEFSGIRPFFCQVEAVETAIWLHEVAPKLARGKKYLERLDLAGKDANPGLSRLALKLATGAGKTTVMAMLIAWQTLNAVRSPLKKGFARGFLIVAPGITIKDRLRVLKPNDPDAYYQSRELVPPDMLRDLNLARIVITNYHAFRLREKLDIAKGTRAAIEGWRHDPLRTLESEGEMLARVMPELMGLKRIIVINDEAHHCYREREGAGQLLADQLGELSGAEKQDARKEAEENREAARIWINGLYAVKKQLEILRVFDLSATPFFLSGSGYAEGTLFPWTMSDFSLMDAIECGIVKLPRVPVSGNIPGQDVPMFRDLWKHIKKKMPKKGRLSSLDPLSLPVELLTALDALYGHYETVFRAWEEAKISVPPCFIIVCNNTSTSKLVYEYISGFYRENTDGDKIFSNGRLPLFRNFAADGSPLPRPRTLLIDSRRLEEADSLDPGFAEAAKDEIARFKREILQRGGPLAAELHRGGELPEAAILREVMNTVGKPGQLGESIRCVVSVSMLTEGWDANTVTHVLGVRAFGTQLLCEQVVGRALRRRIYDLNENGLFDVEYADVLGIPFDFTARPVIPPPAEPKERVHVRAMHPERDRLEIGFPRVSGYRIDLPEERLEADFDEDSRLVLTPDIVGQTRGRNEGIIGEGVDLGLERLDGVRENTILMHLARHLLMTRFRDGTEEPKLYLFGQIRAIVGRWYKNGFSVTGGVKPAQLLYRTVADMACERIYAAIIRAGTGAGPGGVRVMLDPYNPSDSTRHVNFFTSKEKRWQTDSRKCHINFCLLDSDWEGEFCRVAEANERVLAYVKNHNLGFEIPYVSGGISHVYIPDFILLVDDGRGLADPLHLVVEVKGYRGENAREKKNAIESYWLPGVNALRTYGRWAFAELRDAYNMESDLATKVEEAINNALSREGG